MPDALDFYLGTHLAPVVEAVRDGDVTCVILHRRGKMHFAAPWLLRRRGLFVVIGDDRAASEGPDGFSLRPILSAMRAATNVVVHAAAPEVSHYTPLAAAAAMGERVLIVETQEAHESAWLRFAMKHAPRTPLLVITPRAAAWSSEEGHA